MRGDGRRTFLRPMVMVELSTRLTALTECLVPRIALMVWTNVETGLRARAHRCPISKVVGGRVMRSRSIGASPLNVGSPRRVQVRRNEAMRDTRAPAEESFSRKRANLRHEPCLVTLRLSRLSGSQTLDREYEDRLLAAPERPRESPLE